MAQGTTVAQQASIRLAATYRQAYWLIGLAMVIAAVMVAAALLYFSRSISAPLLQLANRMHRLAVNDTLRQACYPWGSSDAEIRGLLIELENDRQNGVTRNQVMSVPQTVCTGPFPENNINCWACDLAVIDQIYGH